MKDEKFKEILDSQSSLKDLPNTKLVEYLDLLSYDFDSTKESIIKSTLYLDSIEELYNRVLKVYQDRNPIVKRLFTDHRTVEKEFYERTGMFPIMHTVAIKRETAEKNPWLAKAVFEAYSKAKKMDYEHMKNWGWVLDSLPWYGQEFNETRELMGENFYPYGLQASKASYEAAFRYLYEQGLSKRLVSLEEMFDKSTLDLFEENNK